MNPNTSRLWLALALIPLLFLTSCYRSAPLLTEGEMLYLQHKGASMPLLVRGNPNSSVIILMVHGGAGGTAVSHIEDFMNEIETQYRVAYWDQRHAGVSQGNFDKEELTIDLMAEDMQMVVRLLKQKYGADQRIFAAGHSWGVILGTYYLISQENELAGAIFSNGSHSSEHETSARMDYVRRFAQEMLDKGLEMEGSIETEMGVFENLAQVIAWCNDNDPITTYPQLRTQYDLVDAVYGYVRSTYIRPTIDIDETIPSRDIAYYSYYNPLTAWANSLRTGDLINDTRPGKENSIQEFYDFTPEMDNITLPISLIFGRYDDIIGPEVAEDYFEVIGTAEEDKELHFLEESGHSGIFRENRLFSRLLIEFVEKHK